MRVDAELTDRWTGGGRETATAVRTWLAGRGPRPDGLGEVGGRVDLRGLPLTREPATLGSANDDGAGVSWEGLDLSHARADALQLFGGRIRDCVLDGASLVDLRVHGTAVDRCSFRQADLRNASLGTGEWRGRTATWSDVDFSRAKLHRATVIGATLERCRFERPGRLLQLQDCRILDCTFSGLLDSLVIDGRGHRHPVSCSDFRADFRAAELRGSSITGYDLSRTSLPDQDGLVMVRRYADTLQAAAARLDGTPDAAARQFLLTLARAPGTAAEGDLVFDLRGVRDPGTAGAVRRALAG